jgi:glycerol kinase
MSKYILSIDAGTTSNRAVLVDHAGKFAETSRRELKQIFPKPGWWSIIQKKFDPRRNMSFVVSSTKKA